MTEPTIAVHPEVDATPLVRLLTRTIRTSLQQRPEIVAPGPGLVVVRSVGDAQVATISIIDDLISVAGGADPDATAFLTVDLGRRLDAVRGETADDGELLTFVAELLGPELPPWRDAARDFWAATESDVGMPRTLVVQNADVTDDVLQLGEGLPRYVLHGSSDCLAGIFTGADSFLDEVFAGTLLVRGTLPQLSVMAGASFKVRFHV